MPGTRVRLRRPEHKLYAGHPRLIDRATKEDVDGRDKKPGHDERGRT
jgi:hypothetical protein